MDCPYCGKPLGNLLCPVTGRVACPNCAAVLTDEEQRRWMDEE